MNTLDIVIGLILILAFFMGFKKGLLMALASLIGVIVGVFGALYFSEFAKGYLINWFDWNEGTTNFVAFISTFLIIILVFSLIGRILTKVADFAMLGIFNKIGGGIFNVLKYAFLVSVVFMFVNASENYTILSEEKRNESILYGTISALAPAVIPEILRGYEKLEDENKLPEIDTVEEGN